MNNQLVPWINDLTNRINSAQDCRTLAVLEQEILANLNALIAQEETKIEQLVIQMIPPTTLPTAIIWITNYINQNIVQPYLNAVIELEQLTQATVQLTSAIQNKLQNLTCLAHPSQTLQTMGAQLAGGIFIGGG